MQFVRLAGTAVWDGAGCRNGAAGASRQKLQADRGRERGGTELRTICVTGSTQQSCVEVHEDRLLLCLWPGPVDTAAAGTNRVATTVVVSVDFDSQRTIFPVRRGAISGCRVDRHHVGTL